jgi:hypothetical protein
MNFVLRRSRENYYQKQLHRHKNCSWKLWSILNEITKRSTTQKLIYLLRNGSSVLYSEVPAHSNEYFSGIAMQLVDKLPASQLRQRTLAPYVSPTSFLTPTDPSEVRTIIRLEVNKHYHMNEIESHVFEAIGDFFPQFLAEIFNQCMSNGFHPGSFKMGRIVPIFKSSNSEDVSNYRPITTLPIFNKFFEKILHDRLPKFFECNSVFK